MRSADIARTVQIQQPRCPIDAARHHSKVTYVQTNQQPARGPSQPIGHEPALDPNPPSRYHPAMPAPDRTRSQWTFVAWFAAAFFCACAGAAEPSSNADAATGHAAGDAAGDASGMDAGGMDADGQDSADIGAGRQEECCRDGLITTCFCPANSVCNYDQFEDCGDGFCANPGESCPQ